MDLRALRYYVQSVELGSITAAAEACHVAQPSITHAIAQLEQEFDTTFLIRSRKGVTPTEEGALFFGKAKALLQHAQFVQEEMRQHQQESEFLYVSPAINAKALTLSMTALRNNTSDVQWQLTQDSSKANYWLINDHELSNPPPSPHQWQPLVTEEYYLLVPVGHEAANLIMHKQTLTIEHLIQYDWIERTHCPFKEAFDHLLHQLKLFEQIKIQASVSNDDWALSLVASGYGITISPVTPSTLDSGIYPIPLSMIEGAPQPNRTIGLLKNKRR